MPDDLKLPGNRQEGGPDDVNVMEFLNLKRAPSMETKKKEESG